MITLIYVEESNSILSRAVRVWVFDMKSEKGLTLVKNAGTEYQLPHCVHMSFMFHVCMYMQMYVIT